LHGAAMVTVRRLADGDGLTPPLPITGDQRTMQAQPTGVTQLVLDWSEWAGQEVVVTWWLGSRVSADREGNSGCVAKRSGSTGFGC